MASAKALLGGLLGRFVFRDATVTAVHDVAPRFRRIELSGERLRDVAWSAGDKVQVFLGEAGMRTYTPLSWDAARGRTAFLVHVHGDAPGAAWARAVKAGDRCQFFGPRGSLALEGLRGPAVLFGDETSFAVAHTLHQVRRASADIACVFEVSSAADSRLVLGELGLGTSVVIEKQANDAHLDATVAALRESLARWPDARLVLTGRAQAIQKLRAQLKSNGIAPASQLVKAYWSLGKTGLD